MPPEIPQHNSMFERRNQILLDMVRSMIGFTSLSISFWRYVLKSACYILNKVLSKLANKIPHKIWTGRKLVLSHLRIWEYPTYVKYLKMDKLRARSDKYIFIGYLKETKGYYFYLADEQKVFVSSKAHFLEKEFFSEGISASKIELDKVRQVKELTPMIESEPNLMRSNLKPNEQTSLRRSGSVQR